MLTDVNQKAAMAAEILRGEENAKRAKAMLLQNHAVIDPIVIACIDNVIDSFSSLRLINLNSPESSRQNSADLVPHRSFKRKRSVEKKGLLERKTYHTETPIVNDGCSWKKYGQKTIKNFHHKRNYFRCVSSNKNDKNCRVTKHEQKIQDSPAIFETTYFGRHVCNAAPSSLHPQGSSMFQLEGYNEPRSDSYIPLLINNQEIIQLEASDPLMDDNCFSSLPFFEDATFTHNDYNHNLF